MVRVWKWARWVGVGVLALVALSLALWVAGAPGMARRMATRQLQAMGLGDVALEIRGVSLGHVQMANVAAGRDRLRIGAVGVTFRLRDLFRGRLSTIELTGLETEVRLRDGQLDLGPLAEMGAGGEGENPFTQIQLRSCALLLDLEGQRLRLPVWGTISDLGGGRLRLHLDATVEGAELRLRGSVDTNAQDFELTLYGQVREIASLLAAQPWWPKPSVSVSGPVNVEATCSRDKAGWRLRAAVVQPAPLQVTAVVGGQSVFIRSLGVCGGIELADGTVQKAGWTLRASDIDAAGWHLDAADATASMSGDALLVSLARVRGRGWSLTANMCRATGLANALAGKPGDIRMETPWWELSLEPQQLGAGGPAPQVASHAPITISGRASLRATPNAKDSKTMWSWALEVPEAEAAWRSGEIAFPSLGVALQGVEARLRVHAAATAQKATVALGAGSAVTVDAVKLPWLELLKSAQGPLLAAELGGKGLAATAAFGGDKPDWSLDVPELVLKQAEADVVLPNGLGKIEGCRGEFAFSVKADQNEARIGAAGPWLLALKSAQAVLGGELLSLGPAQLGFVPTGAVRGVAVQLAGADAPSAEASFDVVVKGPVPASFGQWIRGAVLGAQTEFEGGWSAKGGAHFAANTVSGIEAAVERKLGEAVLEAHLPEGRLDVGVVVPSADEPVTVGLSLGTEHGGKPVTVSVAGADVTAGKAEAIGKATLGRGAPVVEAKVSLDKVAVTHKASGVAVAGLSAEVPVSWNGKDDARGKFAIERLEAGGVKLANVAGTLRVADARAEFTAACAPLKGAKLSVEGTLDASRGAPQGTARLSLPLFELKDENALAALVPQLRGLVASGTFGVEGFARLAGGQARTTLTITVLDGAFRSREWEADAEGVFATVRLSGLAPPLTPRKELQLVMVKRAKIGALDVRDGFLAFRLEPVEEAGKPLRWAAFIQRAEFGWCGGRLYDENVRLDPQAAQHTFTVHADDLKLSEVLPLVAGERASGVGAVSGVLPVTLRRWPDLRFGDGELRAAAGQRGWLQVRDAKALAPAVDAVAAAQVPRGVSEAVKEEIKKQVHKRIMDALSDFEYDELRVVFRNEAGRFMTRAFAKGRGRTADRQEIGGLNLNFSDLDTVLREAILKTRGVLDRPRR